MEVGSMGLAAAVQATGRLGESLQTGRHGRLCSPMGFAFLIRKGELWTDRDS